MKIDNLIVRKGIFKEISSNLRFACASICQLEMGGERFNQIGVIMDELQRISTYLSEQNILNIFHCFNFIYRRYMD